MLKFNPKDGREPGLMDAGEYTAEIIKVEESNSKKSGLPMLVVSIKAHGADGATSLCKDYIVIPSTQFKLKKLCKAVGLEREYEAGALEPQDLVGRSVRVALGVEEDASGAYQPRNCVKTYLAGAAKAVAAKAAKPAGDLDIQEDAVPF